MGDPPTGPSRDNEECPECGYSLLGLVGSTCPECGADVDRQLAVRRSAIRPWLYIGAALALAAGWMMLFVLARAAVFVIEYAYGGGMSTRPGIGALWMVGINAIGAFFLFSRRRAVMSLSDDGKTAFRSFFVLWLLLQPCLLFVLFASA